MNLMGINGPISVSNPWLRPLDARVLGGLRGKMTQQTDGTKIILRPRQIPLYKKSGFSYISAPPLV